jgi:hypothetical protein
MPPCLNAFAPQLSLVITFVVAALARLVKGKMSPHGNFCPMPEITKTLAKLVRAGTGFLSAIAAPNCHLAAPDAVGGQLHLVAEP